MKTIFIVLLCVFCGTGYAVEEVDLLYKAVKSGDISALNNLQALFDKTPLEMYPRYYALTQQLALLSEAEVTTFLARYKETSLAEELRAMWLRELAKRADWSSYLQLYPTLSTPSVELTCYYMNAALMQNNTQPLYEQKKLWFSSKALPKACHVPFEAMFERGILNEEDGWQRIRMALAVGNTSLATQLVRRVSGLSATQIRQVEKNPQKTLPDLDRSNRAGQELTVFALNKIARVGDDTAATLLAQYQAQLPAPIAAIAWGQLGLIAAKKLSPIALRWYKNADITLLSDEERSWLARIAIRHSDWKTVQATIRLMPTATQQLPIWRYWYARALGSLNKLTDAKAILKELTKDTGYYGLLAREELGERLEAMPTAFTPSSTQMAAIKRQPGVQRALLLYRSPNWRAEATREWNWAMQNLSDEALLTASALAYQVGWYDRAVYSAERTQQTHNYRMRFPFPEEYHQQVDQYAKLHGLDIAWVYGLIRQESRFTPSARSSAGAVGLMQIMPATAKWIANRLGLERIDWRNLHFPPLNIQFGLYYLQYVYDLLDENDIMATAGYNAGPRRPRKWLADKPLEGAKWIESIPFEETREYVKKVMANAIHYGQQINQQSGLLKLRLGTVPAQ